MRIDARTQETKAVAERASQAAVAPHQQPEACPPEAGEGQGKTTSPS